MINELYIKNFKCFKEIAFKDFKRVNLFTGKNNTGKSSALEAISLFCADVKFDQILNILEFRSEVLISNNNFEAVALEKENVNSLLKLFNYNSKEQTTQFSLNTKNNDILLLKIVNDSANHFLKINNSDFNLNLDLKKFAVKIKSAKPNLNYISTNTSKDLGTLWDNITLTDSEINVIDSLKLINDKIIKLSFILDKNGPYRFPKRYPIVRLTNSKKLFNLKDMGDGINKILNIILNLVNSENGYLFIDEFENGLHYSVQEKLWEIIFELAIKLNVQVFATTHSNDAIVSFAKVLQKKEKYDGSLIRLQKIKDGSIMPFNFTEEEIITAAEQKVDLR